MSLDHQPPDIHDTVSPPELMRQLGKSDGELPEALQAQVLAAGHVPPGNG